MKASTVDPRDPDWETSDPRYRVYFHDSHRASFEYEVADARDVREVLAWAEANRGERTFVVYACADHDGIGLVRLQGHDPNETAKSMG